MSKPVCRGIRTNGTACRATPTASDFCFAHDEKLRQKTSEGRRSGGKNSSNAARARRVMTTDLQEISRLIDGFISGVYHSKITPAQGQALSSLLGHKMKVYELAEMVVEIEDLKARLGATGTQGRGW